MCLSSLFSLDTMSREDDLRSQALTKPAFSETQASALVESVFGLKVSRIQPLPSYDDQNFHVSISRTKDTTDGPTEYVLKISNTESSKTPELIEVQSHIIMFLQAAGFPTASVCHTKGDSITSLVSVGKKPPPCWSSPVRVHYCVLATGGNIKNRFVAPSVDAVICSAARGGHNIPRVQIRGSDSEVVRARIWYNSSP